MNYLIIITMLFLLILIMYYFYLLKLNKNINKLETKIQKDLQKRTDIIPSIFEISKDLLVKHSKIFEEIIKLRKLQFSLNDYNVSFIEFVKNEIAINHEIRFIYTICSKNKELSKSKKFEYTKSLIIEKNQIIWKKIEEYKKNIKILNYLITLKNYTFIWFLFPIRKRVEFDLIKNIF